MFKFALDMYVADMKRSLRKVWWLAPILFILIVVGPFHDAQMYSFTYLIMMTIYLFLPKVSRIHFVVPLSIKQLKQLFVWRIVLIGIFLLVSAGIVIGISEWKGIEWNKNGFFWLAFYMVLIIFFSETGLRGLGIKNGFEVRHVFAIIIGIISMLIPFELFTDYVPFVWQIGIAFVLVLFSIVYMFHYIKLVKFEDYTYIPLMLWENGKKERD